MKHLDPTPIFHITAIDNLKSIASAGALCSKERSAEQGFSTANIAYAQIQAGRAVKEVPIDPRGTLHDYVPFYFAPRSPMLGAINSGNVEGCTYRQNDVVHLVSDAQRLATGSHRFVFSDVHALLDEARFFGDLAQLSEIDWRIFFEEPQCAGFCRYWFNRPAMPHHVNRKDKRQAEFLVHKQLPIADISEIGVSNAAVKARVDAILANTGWAPNVRVVPGWYF